MSITVAVDLSKVAVILPTWNAERYFECFAGPLLAQGIRTDQVLIIDSESKDRTVARARSLGFRVYEILQSEFNHGGTRGMGVRLLPWAEILIYTTQDAVMESPHTLRTLLAAFQDPKIGVAYGRQIPHPNADPFACHHCAFNYPAESAVRDYGTRLRLGYKTVYCSDSFAAYRRIALEAVGGFPARIISSEDFYVTAKMMLHGWKSAYIAEAVVRHSHNQALSQIFQRYFDIGVMHSEETWILETYGKPRGEGMRFIRSEVEFLRRENPLLIPKAFLRTAAKFLGYQLGRRERWLPTGIKRRMSTLRAYWMDEARQIP